MKNKKITISLIIVSAVVLAAIVLLYVTGFEKSRFKISYGEFSPKQCEKEQGAYKDDCYYVVAQQRNDSSICLNIGAEIEAVQQMQFGRRYRCVLSIEKNTRFCDTLNATHPQQAPIRSSIYIPFVVPWETKPRTFYYNQEHCYLEAVRALKNKSICKNIKAQEDNDTIVTQQFCE